MKFNVSNGDCTTVKIFKYSYIIIYRYTFLYWLCRNRFKSSIPILYYTRIHLNRQIDEWIYIFCTFNKSLLQVFGIEYLQIKQYNIYIYLYTNDCKID